MRVPDNLLKNVVYIGHTVPGRRQGSMVDRYEGTGFFIGLESPRVAGMRFNYLVTARHVAEIVEGNFWIRVNTPRGVAEKVVGGHKQWTTHPAGKSVDVAAILLDNAPEDIDHLSLPAKMLLHGTTMFRELGIGVGDEVFMIGVFADASGRKRNTPIVRKGNLAMLPEDKIRTSNLGEIDAYLVEAHSLGGLSGSPVFVRETVPVLSPRGPVHKTPNLGIPTPELREAWAAGRYYLLGLVHGHWQVDPEDVDALYVRAPVADELGINLGIAIVVPTEKIMETLNQPELVREREQAEDAQMQEGALPVADSASRPEHASGPEPERLAIDLPMDEAVKKMFGAGKPPKE